MATSPGPLIAAITAIAAAVAAVAGCIEKTTASKSPPPSQPPVTVVVPPPTVATSPTTESREPQQQQATQQSVAPTVAEAAPKAAAPPAEALPRPSSQLLSPSTEVVPRVLASARELRALNATRVQGNNGMDAELRLHDARERVRLANYIAQNSQLLQGLASSSSEIKDALDEARKLPEYQRDLDELSARSRR